MSEVGNPYKDRLLDRIIHLLADDRYLSDALLAYINGSLFPPEPKRLAVFLNEDADSERDSLLDLIFFPDQAVQIDLEPLLESARFSKDDETDILAQLMARRINARILLPDKRQVAFIRVPGFIKSQYLERLNIAWHLDGDVAAAISSGVSVKMATTVKVRLRNAALRAPSTQRMFLCRFFERMGDGDPDYLACLDLVLAMLDKHGTRADLYDRLVDHKRTLFRSLQQAKRFEIALRQFNMETLMLQGLRPPQGSPDELVRHIRLIDLICFRMFGKTEAMDTPVEEPLREIADTDNLKAAIRSLLH